MKSYKQSLEEQYKLLFSLYGIGSRVWDDMYRSFSAYTFCDANKKSIIAMYLELEEFTLQAKAYGVVYYCGIDDFLELYHNAVYNCLNIKENGFIYECRHLYNGDPSRARIEFDF